MSKCLECISRHKLGMHVCVQSGGYGALSGGYMMECSCATSRKLLSSPPCPMLAALGAFIKFELAVGQNGRVWVSAPTAALTVLVASALQQVGLSRVQAELVVKRLLESVR